MHSNGLGMELGHSHGKRRHTNVGYSRTITASTDSQLNSLAEKKQSIKYCQYFYLTLENRTPYFDVSCNPITIKAEDDMEMLSDLIGTVGELFTSNFEKGTYICAQCNNELFSSNDKWKGPCVWPSFRKGIDQSLLLPDVFNYNDYKCRVSEVYCKNCALFIGHRFEDGKSKGDVHEDAQWRY